MIDYLGIAYSLLVAGGGVMGYVQAKSIPSLAAGLVFGSVIGFGAYQVSANQKATVSILTSTALGSMMGYRFYNSGKIMPAGLIAAISFLMLVYYITIGVLFYLAANYTPAATTEPVELESGSNSVPGK